MFLNQKNQCVFDLVSALLRNVRNSSLLAVNISDDSAGPFVISLFLFVKIDLATDSGSEYDRDEKQIGFHFFLHV